MTTRNDPTPANERSLARFLDRVRSSFSHDLRTPLGTIVNYAAVLESTQGVDAADVRDLGRRIRGNAQRATRMIQLLANATGLASRPLRTATTDLLALAQSILTDVGGRGRVRLAANTTSALVEVDAEVLGFAWRAYNAVEHDSRAKPIDDAELELNRAADALEVELRCGAPAPNETSLARPVLELPGFLRHNGGPDRLESGLGLQLAQDLVVSLGGELHVWGRPGIRSGLRLRFPQPA